MTVDVEVEVLSKENTNAQKKLVKSLADNVKQIKQSSDSLANQLKVIHVNGDTLLLDRVETVGSITGVCLDGMVFDNVQKSKNGKIQTEETCGKGTEFLNFFPNYARKIRGVFRNLSNMYGRGLFAEIVNG